MKPKIKATCAKLQLQLLSFCLLCLSGKTRCDGNGPAVVTVEQDRDAVLPCSPNTKENIEAYHFEWKKAAQKDGRQKEVFYYDAGITYDSGRAGQSEEFKGRVSHSEEGLRQGNASIIIRNTAVSDSGNYTCDFPDLQPRQTFPIKLVVDRVLKDRTDENISGAISKPNIRTLDETDNRMPLQCEVNGNPEPEVEWRDSAGKTLPARKSVVTERDGFFITLNTAVTKTDRYHCVATQESISHQVYAETSVLIPEPVIVTVEQDENALLPCSRSTENIEHFDWNKVPQNDEKQKEVFRYEGGKHSNSKNPFGSQDDGFKGRVFHFQEELKQGNASISIRKTKMADNGNYTCTLTEPRQTFHIQLVVGRVLKDRTDENIRGATSKPNIRILDETDNRALLLCEVHGNPEPEVEWRDSAGKTLPAQKSVVPERDGFFITLNTTVTKTDHYRCVATQESISHQISTETFVRLNDPAVVTVKQDSDAVLPCSPNTKENIESYHFEWKKAAQKDGRQKGVFYYSAGITYDSGQAGQSEEFKGRVSHSQEGLKQGNASIIIRNTAVSDSGDYTCDFPDLQPRQTFHIELVVEPAVVAVKQDGDALLPCSLTTENIEQEYFYWYKVAQNDEQKDVFQYEKGKHTPGFGSQDDWFKGRVSHFPQELKHGNASIIIRNTKMDDDGDYACVFPHRQTFHIQLVVDRVLKDRSHENIPGAAPKPNIRTRIETEDWALLQCDVHGNPQPEVEWQNSAGNKLPAEKPQVSKSDGRFYVTLNTVVTKTDRYRCVATQESISHQINTETSVLIPEDSGSGVHSSDSTGWIVFFLLLVLLIVVGGVLAVLVHKGRITLHCNKDSRTHQMEASGVPLNDSPPAPKDDSEDHL